jgi:hypothetical protein
MSAHELPAHLLRDVDTVRKRRRKFRTLIWSSHIIHDWSEAPCLTILDNCRKAMGPDSTLLIVEFVLPAGNEPHFGKLLDMVMLAMPGGEERTAAEYGELLAKAGFTLKSIVPTERPPASSKRPSPERRWLVASRRNRPFCSPRHSLAEIACERVFRSPEIGVSLIKRMSSRLASFLNRVLRNLS